MKKGRKLVDMRDFTHVHLLTNEERAALVEGIKSKTGFAVRRSHILLLSAEGISRKKSRLACTAASNDR